MGERSVSNFQTLQNKIHCGDAIRISKQIPDHSIHQVITSPPYWRLRDYGYPKQWGWEITFQEYLAKLWILMDEIWRMLRNDGNVFINLGDCYNSNKAKHQKIQYKSLLMIPSRFAIGCIDRGWILRNNIIWAKSNSIPSSVTDRFSNKHESFFFFTKSQKYFFNLDAAEDQRLTKENRPDKHDRERILNYKIKEIRIKNENEKLTEKKATLKRIQEENASDPTEFWNPPEIKKHPEKKNPGDVSDFWNINTEPNSSAHVASYNMALLDKPILAGSPKDGIILDPFAGIGTTLIRAKDHGRRFIGIEGSRDYCRIFEEWLLKRYGVFKDQE